MGTFSVEFDHVETSGFDPGYFYKDISGDNVCASIEFNWTGGNSTGHWTNILLHSSENSFGTAFQIRNDDATHHRWVFYDNRDIYSYGTVDLDETQTHTLKACTSGSKVLGYLDGNHVFTGDDPTHIGGYMGFASQSPTYYLDNFKIDSLETNSSVLNIPLIKQTDPLWKNKVYDSANSWSPKNTGIGSWGCALTSAAMVFQFHTITKMPDNSPLNPDTLNAWLKKEPDGYVNTGWVNWLALSRLSKKAKDKNPSFAYDALEYKRYAGANKIQLTTDLTNNIPDILEEPGHFIVAKGIQDSTFLINDPYFSRTLLTDYNNTFNNLGKFTPSNTDLSYILFYSDKDTSISVKDPNGNAVGESFIQDPITNETNASQLNGQPFTMFLLEKPSSTVYTISINSTKNHTYTLNGFMYDSNGEVVTKNVIGAVGKGNDTYKLKFDKEDLKKNKLQRIITYDSVIDDIRELQSNNLILRQIADGLVTIINKAKNPQSTNHKAYSLAALNSFKLVLTTFKGKGIDQNAYQILFDDINYLISSL
jgi:hypothetical protein